MLSSDNRLKVFKSEADEIQFWRTCCERGITICRMPKPFAEDRTTLLVEKCHTFVDRNYWDGSYTFDTLEEAVPAVRRYFETNVEPKK